MVIQLLMLLLQPFMHTSKLLQLLLCILQLQLQG